MGPVQEAIAVAQAEATRYRQEPSAEDGLATGWTMATWLSSQPLGDVLADTLRLALGHDHGPEHRPERAVLCSLGRSPDGHAALVTLLQEGGALEALASCLLPAMEALAHGPEVAKLPKLGERFIEQSAVLSAPEQGSWSTVQSGLQALLGVPPPTKAAETVEAEHCHSLDSNVRFRSRCCAEHARMRTCMRTCIHACACAQAQPEP